jgi:hypothetical protein
VNQVMVRYTVKADQAARNEELVKRVYEELHETAPAGFRYATFVMDDGVSFVHVFSNDRDDQPDRLMEVAAFRAFREHLEDRCEDPPARAGIREVGSYGFWSE